MYQGWDEIQNALKGISLVQNLDDDEDDGTSEDGEDCDCEDGRLNEFMVLQPIFWSSADASTDLVFD